MYFDLRFYNFISDFRDQSKDFIGKNIFKISLSSSEEMFLT